MIYKFEKFLKALISLEKDKIFQKCYYYTWKMIIQIFGENFKYTVISFDLHQKN